MRCLISYGRVVKVTGSIEEIEISKVLQVEQEIVELSPTLLSQHGEVNSFLTPNL